MPVVKTHKSYLKVYSEDTRDVVRPEIEGVKNLPEFLKAFRGATGWSLQHIAGEAPDPLADLTWSAPVNPGVGATLGHLRLEPIDTTKAGSASKIKEEPARQLASAFAGTLAELLRAQHVLWQREAELAAGVPLVQHPEEEKHLAARLESVLAGGAGAIDCQAAALYMLDEATTRLKLRSCWGLPLDRLTEPARPLQGALADLEALLGHAVVLEDTERMQTWKVPEEGFPAAVCVPVSTPTMILGTLWFFADRQRDFNDRETNLMEMVAGRLAADLEREMLLREGVHGVQLKRQVAAAERLQRGGLPSIAPVLDDLEIAGWTAQAESVGGDFFDWFCLPDGLVTVAVGDAMDSGIEGAMSASAVKTALRSHAQYQRDIDRLLDQVNLTLWTGSTGSQFAALFCGLIETATGMVHYGSAGQISVVLLEEDGGWKSLSQAGPALGEGPETSYEQFSHLLEPGQSLVIFSNGFTDARDEQGRPLGETGLAQAMTAQSQLSAQKLVDLARDRLEAHAVSPNRSDRTVLVIKRTHP